ncbi:hypothetical protein EDD11_003525 [Mortierella claussenii]|nr:hypothetical protein EDD11_003525 [Mortierella claussenii]
MFPYQWYHPALAIRTALVPGARSMVVKRDTWRAYWVGTLETKKIPAETRGGSPTWRVSLKGVDIIMLYAHGGGFVFGDAEMYNNILCSWVEHFKKVHGKTLRILSVDYDLAPQKKFPYQRDQYLSAYRFLVHEIKWNPRKIIFGGDSSGGNILLNACYVLRENRLPPPRALLCISPWIRLDADELSSPSMAHNRRTDFMPPQVFKKIARCYAGPTEIHDPHVSPFYVQDHTKFPEMAIVYSAAEVLRDDCARFVDHYQATGGRVTYHYMAEGMPHVYSLLRELAGKTAVKDAERRLMEWVNMLVEENRILFESRKRVKAANAAAASATPSTTHLPATATTTLSPSAPISTPKHLETVSRLDLEYEKTPQISHATRIVAAQPTITSHSFRDGANTGNANTYIHDRHVSGVPQFVELQNVVTEKSYGYESARSSPTTIHGRVEGSSSSVGLAGDKEEYFDAERQDDSDDEGDDDDVSVEMLVVDHN